MERARRSARLVLLIGVLVAPIVFSGAWPALAQGDIAADTFTSTGDEINGWWWLRDAQHSAQAEWVFLSLPPAGDIVLNMEVLATDRPSGGGGFDASFYLSYGFAPAPGLDGLFFGRLPVTLPNAHDPNDPTGYTCRGQVTIPREALLGHQTLWIMVKRADDLGEYAPIDMHVAFNAGSITLAGSGEAERTLVDAEAFNSTGDEINGWWWLRDPAYQAYAEWFFDSLPPAGDIVLNLTALATDRVSGGGGFDASFYLYYGSTPVARRGGGILGMLYVNLPNAHDPNDPTGYTCHGQVTIPRDALGGLETLWIVVKRVDDSGAYPPIDMHVAFNAGSITLAGGAVEAERTLVDAEAFNSTGDEIHGWWWLRDPAHEAYAEWFFHSLPAGDIVLNLTALATDRPSGSGGFDASFYLYYGSLPVGGQEGVILGRLYVNLPNAHDPGDPTGYTCHGQVTIPREALGGLEALWIVVKRADDFGAYPPIDMHVAFNIDSITLAGMPQTEETDADSGVESGGPGNVLPETESREDAALIGAGSYTGSLDRPDNEDWYAIELARGQLVTLQLIMPQTAQMNLRLYPPASSSSAGNVTTAGLTHTLEHVANGTGAWLVRVSRASGAGEYQLSIDIANQNDANAGRDAGDSPDGAIRIAPRVYTGFLKPADNEDWYAIELAQGQLVTLQLTMPQTAQMDLRLYPPASSSSVGRTTTAGLTRTVQHEVDGTGIWFARVNRASGEGQYQLTFSLSD